MSSAGSTLTKLISDYLKLNKLQDENTLQPKFVFISKTKSDQKHVNKINELQQNIKNLKLEIASSDNIEERVQTREKYEKELNELKKMEIGIDSNDIIDISKFNFINDLIEYGLTMKPEIMIDNIYDAELRGFLEIAQKTEFKTKDNFDPFKKCIENLGFNAFENKQNIFKNNINKMIEDTDKFKIKVFNYTFEHPKNNNKPCCLMKMPHKMVYILSSYVEKIDKHIIFDKILEKETETLQEYKKMFTFESVTNDLWIKELSCSKEIKDKLKLINKRMRSVISFINILEIHDYENIKTNLPKFIETIKSIQELQNYKIKENTIESIVKGYIKILTKLNEIDKRPNKIVKEGVEIDNFNKLNYTFIKELNSISPFKLSNDTKKRINYCVLNKIEPSFVEKKTKENEFMVSDFSSLESSEKDLFNKDLYAKIGTIVDLKLPKHFRIAIGLKCVSETFKRLESLIALHKYKDSFTITIVA